LSIPSVTPRDNSNKCLKNQNEFPKCYNNGVFMIQFKRKQLVLQISLNGIVTTFSNVKVSNMVMKCCKIMEIFNNIKGMH
jgi:hypothetical protein